MNSEQALRIADEYLEANWETIVADIDKLVRIPSFKEADKEDLGAPWGPGPRDGLQAGLKLAESMGFRPHNLGGYIGWADLKGAGISQIGIIGHMDVVPAGPGWTVEPYQVTRKDGYLLGRGVIDDKGPSVVALHAVKALADAYAAEAQRDEEFAGMQEYTEDGLPLIVGAKALTAAAQEREKHGKMPYTIRFIFGADEECGMGDIPYYRAAQPDPAFLFTPDAEFPVCHGEKGHYDATAKSVVVEDGAIVAIEGGQAPNAVPGQATCTIRVAEGGEDAALAVIAGGPHAENVEASVQQPGQIDLLVKGKSAHASLPEGGVNAIGLLADVLLNMAKQGAIALSPVETEFLHFQQVLISATDGSSLDLEAYDEDFKALTIVGGMVFMEDGCLCQTIDSRYPTSITADEITQKLTDKAVPYGLELIGVHAQEPFLVSADSPEIQALLDAFVEATGQEAQPFTMGGGTYARMFSNAASFGPEFLDVKNPDWVGGMHGPDEGVSEDSLKKAFRIYVLALQKLMELPLR